MVLELLNESNLVLSNNIVEMIVDKVDCLTLSSAPQIFMYFFVVYIDHLLLSYANGLCAFC